MAEAAKRADVSAAAPYRHFTGREDLIAEVALQGYDLFADVLDYAYDEGQPSPCAAFEAVGRAYLAFARKHPGHYIAMFESGVAPSQTPELAARGRAREPRLMRAAEALSARLPPERRPPAAMFAAHVRPQPRHRRALRPRQARQRAAPSRPRSCWKPGSGSICAGWADRGLLSAGG
jgi:AcrR family transcriptional regulator